jgi:hypothetical protein
MMLAFSPAAAIVVLMLMARCGSSEPDLAMSMPALQAQPPRDEPESAPSLSGVSRSEWPPTTVVVPRHRESAGWGLEAALPRADRSETDRAFPTPATALDLDRNGSGELAPHHNEGLLPASRLIPDHSASATGASAAGFSSSRALDREVEHFARMPIPVDPASRLAFLCNAYNANAMHKAREAARRPGFTTVKDTPGFFDRDPIVVGGITMTLDDLETRYIRPQGDPRVHAALVCGAASCPPGREEPFDPARIDAQLDEQCRRWVNDPTLNTVRGDTLLLSPIFDWYGADFGAPSGAGVIEFLRRYAASGGPIAALLARLPNPTIEWLPYDWSLPAAATVELEDR